MKKRKRQSLEEKANVFSLKCLIFIQLVHAVVWILNILNIFIVDTNLMTRSFFGSLAVVVIAILVCSFAGVNKPWIKYFLLVAFVTMIGIVGINITYHAVIFYVLPLLYTIQYCNRKMLYISYILSVISIFITVMGGYRFGLCDANMVTMTTETLNTYSNHAAGKIIFEQSNDNPWVILPLYYVLPRSLALLAMIPLVKNISDNIARQALHEQYLLQLSETDQMTSMYNRNKYIKMTQNYYSKVDTIGVIFWDINGLKETNDILGHEYGDYLITSISDSIREVAGEKKKAYRIGGDEFAMIVEDADEEAVKNILRKWKIILKMKNNVSKIELSVSVGYAVGAGKEIEKIINQADVNMYKEKREYHTIQGRRVENT